MPKLLGFVSWYPLFLIARTLLFVRDTSHTHSLVIPLLWCCRSTPLFFCPSPGCWEFLSYPGGFLVLPSWCLSWSHTSFYGAVPVMLQITARRLRIVGLCDSLRVNHPDVCPYLFSHQRVKSSFKAAWSTVLNSKLNNGSPCFVPCLSRTHHSLCLSRQSLVDRHIASSRSWCIVARFRTVPAHSISICDLSRQTPSCNPPSRSTFWHPIPDIYALTTCTLQDDPVFGVRVETLPGLLAARGRVWSIACCTEVLIIMCTALAVYKLDGSFLLLPRHSFVDHFYSYS